MKGDLNGLSPVGRVVTFPGGSGSGKMNGIAIAAANSPITISDKIISSIVALIHLNPYRFKRGKTDGAGQCVSSHPHNEVVIAAVPSRQE